MKILSISPTYWPAFEFGGPIHSLHYLNQGLIGCDNELTVLTTSKGQTSDKQKDNLIITEGVPVFYCTNNSLFDFLGSTGWNFSLSFKKILINNIKKYDIVYIISVWNYTSAITAYYCKKYSIPYVFSPRGQLYEDVVNIKSWKKMPYYRFIGKYILNNATAIHYTSEDELNNVHDRLGIQCEPFVIENGIPLDIYKVLPKKGSFINKYPHLKNKDILISLGRLNWKKGIDILIQTLPQILMKNQNTHLVIAGNDEDDYKNKLIRMINLLGLKYVDLSDGKQFDKISDDTCITFTGFLNLEQKKEAFVDADVFVLTSHSENFGMSVIESMACGLPVIVSKNVGISDSISNSKSGLSINNTEEEITESVVGLLKDADYRKKMGQRAKEIAHSNYDIVKVSSAMNKKLSYFVSKI